jgi:hypothetical protein
LETNEKGHIEEKINAYRILLRKSEGRRKLGRIRRSWEENIKGFIK